ncbi:MAG: dihydroorotate dehydrogenase-like protein [Actinobacteria bacterium]|nr:dihydroorotate dehydrogenase-like protein [Actinomycetota bacterium]
MVSLHTTYMSKSLASPLAVSASTLTGSLDRLKGLEEAGASAVVLPSLFEEQLEKEALTVYSRTSRGYLAHPEAPTYFPDMIRYNTGPERYLKLMEKSHQELSIPVFASLNGATPGGWVRYASLLEQAGADGLELNIHQVVSDPDLSSSVIEDSYIELVGMVREAVKIPIAVKLEQSFTSLAHFVRRLEEAGVDGLVLFNRTYQPYIDLDNLEVVPRLTLSSESELDVRLRWVAILSSQRKLSIAATGGVQTGLDVLRTVMAGACVAMVSSTLLSNGVDYIAKMKQEMITWMVEHEYESIEQMRGSMSQKAVPDPGAYERSIYASSVLGFGNQVSS